jgi:hypothetical protein
MDTARFWTIVGESRADFDPGLLNGNMARQLERLQRLLRDLSPAEVANAEGLVRRQDRARSRCQSGLEEHHPLDPERSRRQAD